MVNFEVNTFDKDGDLVEEGIYLHFDNCRIKVAETMKDYESFIISLQAMANEIEETINNK